MYISSIATIYSFKNPFISDISIYLHQNFHLRREIPNVSSFGQATLWPSRSFLFLEAP